MKKLIIILLVFSSLFLIISNPTHVSAAKKFAPKKKTVRITKPSAVGIPASVRYRGDKQGILLSFPNFNGIDSVSYSFTYETNGTTQGAGGTIRQDNNPTSQRELLFGTCSSGVCRYHYNLKNARLTLNAKFANGKTATKAYRIKTYQ